MVELLDKHYLTIKDVQQIASIGYKSASEIVKQARKIAIDEGYLLPITNKLIAPTKIIRELLKIWGELWVYLKTFIKNIKSYKTK